MQTFDLRRLYSTRTVRTYPVRPEELLATTRRAVEGLPRWTLADSEEGEVGAVRESRVFRLKDDVKVRLTPRDEATLGEAPHGARAEFESASRAGLWDLGQNRRNLKELLEAIDRELRAKAESRS